MPEPVDVRVGAGGAAAGVDLVDLADVEAGLASELDDVRAGLAGRQRREAVEDRVEDDRPGPAALPALALSVVAISTGIAAISNQLSRAIEARADSYALELTDAPQPFIDFERRITVRNISEPDPPGWASLLFGTHPTTLQRIGAAVAFRESARRAGRPIRGGS